MPSPPETLSASAITTYLGCPRKYRFRYIDRLPPEDRSADLVLGSAVHGAVEWYEQERIGGREATLNRAQRIFRSDYFAGIVGEKISFDGKSKDDLQALGEQLVALYVERFQNEPAPVAVEERFDVGLPDLDTGGTLPVRLIGYLDQRREGVLVELKTAARKSGADTWALQLAAYSYAMKETYGVTPTVRVVQLVKTKTPALHVEETKLGDLQLIRFLDIAGEVYRAICSGTFFPNPGWMCPRCEFRKACAQARSIR